MTNLKCPKVVAEAMAQVQAGIKKIEHDSKNEFANYKYASIDAYYDVVRPLLSDAGLLIIPNEVHAEISADSQTLKVVFEFILLHSSGEVWEMPIRRTQYIPNKGAQACGAALSYAEKFIFRTLFKIPTGEFDPTSEIKTEEVEKEAKHSHDADSVINSKIKESKLLSFEFSGAPYRIFNREGQIHQTYTDIQAWGSIVDKIHKKNAVCSLLKQEIQRVQPEIEKHDVTPAAKQKMHTLLDGILGASDESKQTNT